MNWLYIQEKHERDAAAAAAWERRHHATKKLTPRQKNQMLMRTYGLTQDQLAQSSTTRRQQWFLNSFADTSFRDFVGEDVSFSTHTHSFRDRDKRKEMGRDGHISSLKYVPRAVYKGGGRLDAKKTRAWQSLPESTRTVDAMNPRPATCSLVDIEGNRGRVRQSRYNGPEYILRQRDPARELHPPMRYRAKNDLERVNDSLTESSVMSAGEWEGPSSLLPEWRPRTPDRWLGGNFRGSRPATPCDILSVSGDRYGLSLNASEPAVVSQDSVHLVKDKVSALRGREPERELGGEFKTVVKRDGIERPPPKSVKATLSFVDIKRDYPDRPYHASLRAAPSVLETENY
uniref:Uncharacterized protein n=1 Tax=Rhizochromulina marina TaxID=1034831 RepID=A0A7S2SH67_9STRA|mmetsp:Transcript_30171/g.87878  ORF Transcript_30171/g.87878 Transcript_30171/m.87878 type:complete len:345 (+) Transcript_30171:79-1113(+)